VIRRLYTAIANADPDAIIACYVDDAADDAYYSNPFRIRARGDVGGSPNFASLSNAN
jgi:hypothetical protein